jgi:hypothetical protein
VLFFALQESPRPGDCLKAAPEVPVTVRDPSGESCLKLTHVGSLCMSAGGHFLSVVLSVVLLKPLCGHPSGLTLNVRLSACTACDLVWCSQET